MLGLNHSVTACWTHCGAWSTLVWWQHSPGLTIWSQLSHNVFSKIPYWCRAIECQSLFSLSSIGVEGSDAVNTPSYEGMLLFSESQHFSPLLYDSRPQEKTACQNKSRKLDRNCSFSCEFIAPIITLTSSLKLTVPPPSQSGSDQILLTSLLPKRKMTEKKLEKKDNRVRHAKDKTGPEVSASLTKCLAVASISSIDLLTGDL